MSTRRFCVRTICWTGTIDMDLMHAVMRGIDLSTMAGLRVLTGQSAGCSKNSGDIELSDFLNCCGVWLASWALAVPTAAVLSPRRGNDRRQLRFQNSQRDLRASPLPGYLART